MRVLLSGARGLLFDALVTALARGHDLRLLEPPADPRDRAVAEAAASDREAIVHVTPELAPGRTAQDLLDAAARGTYNLITTATSAQRFVLLSSLRIFEACPLEWRVTEEWRPRPTTDPADLAPYLAELAARECARTLPLKAIALRLGEVVADGAPPNARGLHVDDAVRAVELALAFEPVAEDPRHGWWAFHIAGGGRRNRYPLGLDTREQLGYLPRHDPTGDLRPAALPRTPSPRFSDRPGGLARTVVLFGAGGPLASVVAAALERDHVLRLADLRPLADIIAANAPQGRGAPLPRILGRPHEERQVDVTDPAQVLAAAEGVDAIINMTVMRRDPVEAFRVNTIGAYNVMRAAVARGVRRVVHTGPEQVSDTMQGAYWPDFGIPSDAPARPGTQLYFISKYLGQEICRIFAEEHDLEVPTLLFGDFRNPDDMAPDSLDRFPIAVSWRDGAEAVRHALMAPSYPRPFEVMTIVADLPHDKLRNDTARARLAWQPRDRLEALWRRELD